MTNVIAEYGSIYPNKKRKIIPYHINQGLELVYIKNGEVSWKYEDRTILSKAGTLSFSWPGQYHGGATPQIPTSEIHWIIIKLEEDLNFSVELGFLPAESLKLLTDLKKIYPQIIRVNKQIEFYFMEIIFLLNSKNKPFLKNQILLLVKLLLIQISCENPLDHESSIFSSQTKLIVLQFVKRLEQECTDQWTLRKMCEQTGISRTKFSEIMKEIMGDSPIKILNRFRINYAENLLITTNKSITEIAFDCGFPSSQYLSTVFREYNSMTPTKFRTTMKPE